MQSSKLGNQAWAVAFYMAASNLKGISSLKLRRELETAQRAAWHMPQRIREVFRDGEGTLRGVGESDEVYTGGKDHNRHESRKLEAGRGTVGQTAVVGRRSAAARSQPGRLRRRSPQRCLDERRHATQAGVPLGPGWRLAVYGKCQLAFHARCPPISIRIPVIPTGRTLGNGTGDLDPPSLLSCDCSDFLRDLRKILTLAHDKCHVVFATLAEHDHVECEPHIDPLLPPGQETALLADG